MITQGQKKQKKEFDTSGVKAERFFYIYIKNKENLLKRKTSMNFKTKA